MLPAKPLLFLRPSSSPSKTNKQLSSLFALCPLLPPHMSHSSGAKSTLSKMPVLGVPTSLSCTHPRLEAAPEQGGPKTRACPVSIWSPSQAHLRPISALTWCSCQSLLGPTSEPTWCHSYALLKRASVATWAYSPSPVDTRGGSIIVLLVSHSMSTYFQC